MEIFMLCSLAQITHNMPTHTDNALHFTILAFSAQASWTFDINEKVMLLSNCQTRHWYEKVSLSQKIQQRFKCWMNFQVLLFPPFRLRQSPSMERSGKGLLSSLVSRTGEDLATTCFLQPQCKEGELAFSFSKRLSYVILSKTGHVCFHNAGMSTVISFSQFPGW